MFHTIEEAIRDLKQGKVIIVVDDENRENEGDFVALAEYATPDVINFMASHGRGLICAPLNEEIASRLEPPTDGGRKYRFSPHSIYGQCRSPRYKDGD